MFGPGERVAGDEMNALGQMRANLRDHIGLDRAYVCYGCTRCEMRRDLGGNCAHDAHRHAEHHQISARHGFGGTVANTVAQPDFTRRGAGFIAAGIAGHFTRQPAAFHRPVERRCDQPEPYQGNFFVNLRHQRPPLNWRTAWTTRRQALSSPTVMRRHCGRL